MSRIKNMLATDEENIYDGLDDSYWMEKAKWQEMYERELLEEMTRNPQLPVNEPIFKHDAEDYMS